MRVSVVFPVIVLLTNSSCSQLPSQEKRELHVAAASNLIGVLDELGRTYEARGGIHVTPSFGSTAQLTQQIENGAPFDIFLAADADHVDELIGRGFAASESRAIYARGSLVLWTPQRPDIESLKDLERPQVTKIALAKPELAPYGRAAVESLQKLYLWKKVEPKIVYAQNISIARQYADTANVDAAFTALSLVIRMPGHYIVVGEDLHRPIEQALCIVKSSKDTESARAFAKFLLSAEAQAVLKSYGYQAPS